MRAHQYTSVDHTDSEGQTSELRNAGQKKKWMAPVRVESFCMRRHANVTPLAFVLAFRPGDISATRSVRA